MLHAPRTWPPSLPLELQLLFRGSEATDHLGDASRKAEEGPPEGGANENVAPKGLPLPLSCITIYNHVS